MTAANYEWLLSILDCHVSDTNRKAAAAIRELLQRNKECGEAYGRDTQSLARERNEGYAECASLRAEPEACKKDAESLRALFRELRAQIIAYVGKVPERHSIGRIVKAIDGALAGKEGP